MTLLRDLPEGVRIVDEGTPGAPIDTVDWLDEQGTHVRLVFHDGSIRTGDGNQEVSLSGSTATPARKMVWHPPRWHELAEEAWTSYIAGNEEAALSKLNGFEEVEFTGNYDTWTFVEMSLVLRALIVDRQGQHQQASLLKDLLNVEDRAAHPAIARKVMLRGFAQALPDEPYARLRETARRWARADHAGLDGTEYLAAHDAALAEIRE
jgi:hypothetical protein